MFYINQLRVRPSLKMSSLFSNNRDSNIELSNKTINLTTQIDSSGHPKLEDLLHNFVRLSQYDIKMGFNQTTDIEHTNSTNGLELFKLSWYLVPNKYVFVLWLLVTEFVSFLTSYGLITQNSLLTISAPLLSAILCIFYQIYNFSLMFSVKHQWKQLSLDYFADIKWIKKKEQEDMTDFDKMIDRSSNALFSIVSWGVPTVFSGVRSMITVFAVLIIKGYWQLILSTTIIYFMYFKFFMKHQQDKLVDIRKKMKEVEKSISSKKKLMLELYKNSKRNSIDILELDKQYDALDNNFLNGWTIISNGMTLVSCIIAFVGLFGISNWDNFLLVKIIFDDLKFTIETFSHFSNNFISRSKDFDKFIDWYENTNGRYALPTQLSLPDNGLHYSNININFFNKFMLTSINLSICPGDIILLRGPTASGKTQIINALQGLITGATLDSIHYQPNNYTKVWEYMNQDMRESIPNTGLSLRELLEGENDTNFIMDLVKVVQLDDKIKISDDIDIKIQGYSGGQKMKLSIIFTIWEVIRQNKTLLVLDEPEQGLDSKSRKLVIESVLSYLMQKKISVLIIYHGDDFDIIRMHQLFNKIWLFEPKDGLTKVKQLTRENDNIKKYCRKLLDNYKRELLALDCVV